MVYGLKDSFIFLVEKEYLSEEGSKLTPGSLFLSWVDIAKQLNHRLALHYLSNHFHSEQSL